MQLREGGVTLPNGGGGGGAGSSQKDGLKGVPTENLEKALQILAKNPIIDGLVEKNIRFQPGFYNMPNRVLKMNTFMFSHNDFPFLLRKLLRNDLRKVNFNSDLSQTAPFKGDKMDHTDLPRLRKGKVGGQVTM